MAMNEYLQDFNKLNVAAGQGVRVETELDIARSALRQARELSDFAQSVVNRLCGCSPETAEGLSAKEYDPEGVLPQIAQEARRSMADMNSAMAALRRLERFV
jgi:hypothetical protein